MQGPGRIEKNMKTRTWIPFLLGLCAFLIAAWLMRDAPTEGPFETESNYRGDAQGANSDALLNPEGIPALRIVEHGRLTLNASDLPERGSVAMALELSDEARGSGERTIRIVSLDGRRLETRARVLPGSGSGVRLDIDRDFLTEGRYMIEIKTVDAHPLQLRRYVLEVK